MQELFSGANATIKFTAILNDEDFFKVPGLCSIFHSKSQMYIFVRHLV